MPITPIFLQQVSSHLQSITHRQPIAQTAFDAVVPLNNQSANPVVIIQSAQYLLQRAQMHEITSTSVVVNAVLYVHRFLRMTHTLLTSENVVPVLTTALCIANKFAEDVPYDNATFARLSGIPSTALSRLEIHFLAALRFHLHVDPNIAQTLRDAFQQPLDLKDYGTHPTNNQHVNQNHHRHSF